jgi:hypothetical protein
MMTTNRQRVLSTLLAFLLALTCLSASSVQAAAPNRAQTAQQTMPDGLMAAFLAASARPFDAGAEGYRAHSGGLEFTLRAGGLGRGEQIAALPAAEIVQAGGRLEYRRGALTEWYRDTALGVEQGFTLHQAPRGAGPLVLQLDLSTDLPGAPDADGRGLSFAAPDGQTLRYDHLRAWDANGAPLDATLRYAPGQVTIKVDDRGAAYPITIDPLIYLEQKVLATGAAEDYFGLSVALSGDGNTALVGAHYDDIGANTAQGSAYVFTRSLMIWSEQAHLTASDGAARDNFGCSVALDGNTILVGAYMDDVGMSGNQGSAYVFTRGVMIWVEQAHLTALDGAAEDWFGRSVALTGDTALVGASTDDVGTNSDQGSAYFFRWVFRVYLPLVLRNAP